MIRRKNKRNVKYIFISLILLLFYSLSNAQEIKIEMGNITFYLRKELEDNDSGPKIKKLIIVSEKHNTPIRSHILFKQEEDHSSEQIEIGGYKVEKEKLILYTCWIKAGDALDAPCGVRKIVYNSYSEEGLILRQEKNIFYIIAGPQSEESRNSEAGQEFLEKKSIDSMEKKKLDTYIYLIEKKYNGHFVTGKEAEKLLKEVKTFLKKEIAKATSHWNTIEAYQSGICK